MKLTDILNEVILHRMKPNVIYPKLFVCLNELFDFDNLQDVPFVRMGSNAYNFQIEINESDVEFYVDIVPANDSIKLIPAVDHATKIYNVAYAVSDDMVVDRYAITDQKVMLLVMKTVTEIVEDFINRNDPDILTFFAESSDGTERGEQSKLTIYKAVMDKNKPAGYVVSNATGNSGKKGFMLYNSKLMRK